MERWRICNSLKVTDIDREFQEVYQSLVKNGNENSLWLRGGYHHFRQHSRPSSYQTIHRSSASCSQITQGNQSLSLLESPIAAGIHRDNERAVKLPYWGGHTTFSGCSMFSEEQQHTKLHSASEKESLKVHDALTQDASKYKENLEPDLEDVDSQYASMSERENLSYPYSNEEMAELETVRPSREEQHIICEACQKCQRKVLRNKTAAVKKTGVLDPNNWCCDYWMLVIRVPAREDIQRLKRSLRASVKLIKRKQLVRIKRAVENVSKCSRPHPFLQRNLRLCKRARQKLLQHAQQRRKTGLSKSKPQRRKKIVDMNQTKSKVKRPFVFRLDSSIEEDSDLDVGDARLADTKKRKLGSNAKLNDRRLISGPYNSLNSITIPDDRSNSTKQNESAMYSISLLTSSSNEGESDHSFIVEPQESEPELLEYGVPSPFNSRGLEPVFSVQRGSFREMLAKLNAGCSKSAAIKEY
ncbi:uncharacterized protein LOC128645631 [Bombina bombina]|uniref:uncharacterized protein LOC128645631 n=1 Tax=Bombina bombina TaxID=8345 RepID=UPI00235A52F1|nr:uncharacterized protein LOC128645631 [Bombina bombina]